MYNCMFCSYASESAILLDIFYYFFFSVSFLPFIYQPSYMMATNFEMHLFLRIAFGNVQIPNEQLLYFFALTFPFPSPFQFIRLLFLASFYALLHTTSSHFLHYLSLTFSRFSPFSYFYPFLLCLSREFFLSNFPHLFYVFLLSFFSWFYAFFLPLSPVFLRFLSPTFLFPILLHFPSVFSLPSPCLFTLSLFLPFSRIFMLSFQPFPLHLSRFISHHHIFFPFRYMLLLIFLINRIYLNVFAFVQ